MMVSSLSTEMYMKDFLLGKPKLEDKTTMFSKTQKPIIQRTATLRQERQCAHNATFKIVRATKVVEEKQ
jgi:hypothetical protein